MSAMLADVRKLALELPPRDKLALIGELSRHLQAQYPAAEDRPRRSVRGILAHLGPAPSEEDFAEARREAWKNFPRDPGRFDPPSEGEGVDKP